MKRRIYSVAACLATGAISALIGLGCGGDDDSDSAPQTATSAGSPLAPEAEQPLTRAQVHGRDLFLQKCGSCHTLDAAGTTGQIGPNLGDIPLSEQEVRTAIRIGGRGSGNMPPNLVTGGDAEDVAAFVGASGPGAP